MALDPTKIIVESHSAPLWEREESFQDIMAEQLRHAPWLMLSIVIHGMVLMAAWLLFTGTGVPDSSKSIAMNPQDEEEIVEIEPEEEPPEEEETEEEPMLQDTEITEVTEDVTEDFEDLNTDRDFDDDQWNTALGLGGGSGGGKYGNRRTGRSSAKGGRATARAIEMGLEWLKDHQDPDGMWDADEFMKHDVDGARTDGAGVATHDVGVTALALLAFLGDGSTMRSGPYRDVIKDAVMWLRQQQGDNGLFGINAAHDYIYDHALAALAMIEAYGLSDYKLLKRYAQGGINYLESHRNPYSVWRYQPQDNDNDTSITGWAVMAYKSAEDFGLDVDPQAMQNAALWFDEVTNERGQAGYQVRGQPSARNMGNHASLFPPSKGEALTAVGLMCRFFLHQDPAETSVMRAAADTILQKPPVWDEGSGAIDHYYWYYATYALYQMGGRHWQSWSRDLTKAVVNTIRDDGNFRGSWDPVGAWGEDGGRVYSTAILVLTLEAYYRYTRVFIR
jgi:hypothetical protein